MPYLPDGMPQPRPDAEDATFWELCNERRLSFQCCRDCGALSHPPIPVCPLCQSLRRGWKRAPERGRVFSYTWIHAAAPAEVAGAVPYNVALIEFPQMSGVRLVSNVVDAAPGELAIGDAVELVWEEVTGGQVLPRFRRGGAHRPD